MPTDPIRAALERLISAYDEHGGRWPQHDEDALHDAVERARADLAAADANPDLAEGESSDGYHTFAELYQHRHSLMLALMRALSHLCWFSQRHHDGELPFGSADWFIVGANLPTGPITYHLPIELLSLARQTGAAELSAGHPWDGHTASDVIVRLRAWVAAAIEPDPAGGGEALLAAPAAEGEVGKLVAWLRYDADTNDGYGLTESAAFQRRAATLLECLEQVAYAASDFICGTRFPEFANEHGGLDRLMADLCRLVAQFEHGPRPVPGVDVPGPDGDWGGLAELCNAEGVDPRIGVPLLQRAREAWKYASQTAPVPDEGEVAELVEWLLQRCQLMSEAPGSEFHLFTRAAALLEQQAAELAALRAPQGVEVE